MDNLFMYLILLKLQEMNLLSCNGSTNDAVLLSEQGADPLSSLLNGPMGGVLAETGTNLITGLLNPNKGSSSPRKSVKKLKVDDHEA